MAQETYLGDGLYASIDCAHQIVLRAPRNGTDHFVYLDADVLTAFLMFCEQRLPGFIERAAKATKKREPL